MTNPHNSNADLLDNINERITALEANFQPNDAIILAGVTYTQVQVITMYKGYAADRTAVTDAEKTVKVSLGKRKASDAERKATDKALKSFVVTKFGAGSQQAHDFGFPPPKPRTTKVLDKAHAALQAKATRAARHTLGKNQKADIKGSVPPVTALVAQAEADATPSEPHANGTPATPAPPPAKG
jgi:hypothetical protein